MKSRKAERMQKHHKRRTVGGLNLISLMDIFTILVFFLMVNSSDVEVLDVSSQINGRGGRKGHGLGTPRWSRHPSRVF